MATTITATVLGHGVRKVTRNVNKVDGYFYGTASISGKRVKVKKLAKQGTKNWFVA
jgi:hypothetical protein